VVYRTAETLLRSINGAYIKIILKKSALLFYSYSLFCCYISRHAVSI